MTNMSKVNTLAGLMAIGVEDIRISRVNAECSCGNYLIKALVRGAAACSVECGKSSLPIGVMWRADALEGFQRYLPSAVVIALHPGEPSRKPLRGKGVAGGHHFRLAWLGATKGNMPAIGAQYDPAGFSFCVHRHSPSCVTDASRCVSREPRQ